MKQISLMLIMIFLFTACAPAATATPAPTVDIQATVNALSGTMVAATMAAMPTATLVPTNTTQPSEIPALPPTEIATLDPSLPTITATPDLSMTIAPTPTAWEGTFDPGNTDGLPTGLLRIENLTGVKEIIVTLKGVTFVRAQPIYYAYKITGALNITILWARYSYIVQIPGKRIITGTFGQNSKDKTTMSIYLTKVAVHGP